MSSRPVLIIHSDPRRRLELKTLLAEREVLEAESRAQAVPLLSSGALSLVLSQTLEFRRLLRDLERHTPGTPRAVLCPDDPEALRQLAELASEGYEFVTIPEHAPEAVKQLMHPRSSVRLVPARPLKASFVVGGVDHLADVAELSNDGLGLALPGGTPVEGLTPGRVLERATVTGEQGVVLERRAWAVRTLRREPGGAGRLLLGVTIEPLPAEQSGRPAVRLHDEVKIRGLVRRAIHRRARFVLQRSDGSGQREYTEAALDASGRLVLSRPRPGHTFGAGEIALLSFELLGSQVEAATAILEAGATRAVVALPRSARRRERREALRIRLEDRPGAAITLHQPLSGQVFTRPLLDLHPMGTSIELDASKDALPCGLTLPDVELELFGRRARCRAVVRTNVALSDDGKSRRVGLRLHAASDADRQLLIDAWLLELVPDVACGSRFGFEALWELFRHEGVRFPDYPLDSPQAVATLGQAHQKMGDGRHGLGKSFVFHEDGLILGHAAGLRTHSKTWLSQHLVVRSGYHRQTHISQALVNLSFDYGEALGDVEYLRGLWRTSNRWTSRAYGAATSRLIRPGLSYLTSFTPMRATVSQPRGAPTVVAHPSTASERQSLLRHLQRSWDPVRLRADDLVDGELELSTLSRRFTEIGLERTRHVGVVSGPRGVRGWVLIERMAPGLFWAEWYDAFRLVLVEPLADDCEQVRLALVHYALADARARGRTFTHCLADDADVASLEQSGFANLGKVVEFCAHRSMNREMTAQLMAIFERLARRERGDDRRAEGDDE
ncbi:MAG: hypothetical protein AMXMBFR34_08950 [Myxococcaceae bacterium]